MIAQVLSDAGASSPPDVTAVAVGVGPPVSPAPGRLVTARVLVPCLGSQSPAGLGSLDVIAADFPAGEFLFATRPLAARRIYTGPVTTPCRRSLGGGPSVGMEIARVYLRCLPP